MDIIGASGHGKVIVDILRANGVEFPTIWDDNEKLETFLDFKVEGDFTQFKTKNSREYILAIGNNAIRKRLANQLIETESKAIHKASVISNTVVLGIGSVVMAGAIINIDSVIGKHAIINSNASLDHDCVIGDFVHVSPKVGLAGDVKIGEGTHVGIGAVIIQGVRIGKWATIGAGCVVIRDVPDFAVVVGNPGKIIKYNRVI